MQGQSQATAEVRFDSGLKYLRPRTWMYTVGWVQGTTLFAYRNDGTGPVKELLDTSNTCDSRTRR